MWDTVLSNGSLPLLRLEQLAPDRFGPGPGEPHDRHAALPRGDGGGDGGNGVGGGGQQLGSWWGWPSVWLGPGVAGIGFYLDELPEDDCL